VLLQPPPEEGGGRQPLTGWRARNDAMLTPPLFLNRPDAATAPEAMVKE